MSDDYLDFRPIGKREGRFHVAEPVNVSSTSSRRPHVRAYLEYMYPELGHTLDKRWETACRVICGTYYTKKAEKVHAPPFDFLVDREVWEEYFADIKSQMAHESLVKTPRWPFRIPPEMMQNSNPSSPEYTEYRNNRIRYKHKQATRESWMSEINANAVNPRDSTSSVPQVPLPALNANIEISSTGAVASVSQSLSTVPREINAKTLTTSLPPNLSEKKQLQWFWELAGGDTTFKPPIIGPFQMKLPEHALFNTCVAGQDLQQVEGNQDVPHPASDDQLDVVLTLGFAKGCGGKLCDRVELLRFWGCMTDWLSSVYDGAALSLYNHLLDSLVSRNGNVSAVSEGLDHLSAKHRELCGNGGQVGIEALEMPNNDDKRKQVQDDKNISGTLMEILPPSTLKHPPMEVVLQMDSDILKHYADQLGRNLLCVSTFAGATAFFFRGEDNSCIIPAGYVANGMRKGDQIVRGMVVRSDNDFSGMCWLTNNRESKDKDAKAKSKPLDGMDEEKEA
ncbi:hypothetical protein FACUT_8434 [Fusarium acutatum]|uniref:Uncharacterized protein n=1 Tax=Fusarium acutatum TaxID=78861 RepID=A0A8H4JMB6_9HYPO|nr:hypothetical protein FACUT_8434 [Fusarium acutatum]